MSITIDKDKNSASFALTRNGRLFVDSKQTPGVARQLAATVSSTNVALTSASRAVSIWARGCDMRYSVGSTPQTAIATTSHFIAAGTRIDMSLGLTPNIAVIRDSAAAVDGTLEITELV